MPQPSRGLYATRLVDITMAIMGISSALMLAMSNRTAASLLIETERAAPHPYAGFALLACVLLVALAGCYFHHIDRQGWDDYMGQIVSQSAMIALVTLVLVSVLFDFLLAPTIGNPMLESMIGTALPVAFAGWSIGYLFLRWKGTNV